METKLVNTINARLEKNNVWVKKYFPDFSSICCENLKFTKIEKEAKDFQTQENFLTRTGDFEFAGRKFPKRNYHALFKITFMMTTSELDTKLVTADGLYILNTFGQAYFFDSKEITSLGKFHLINFDDVERVRLQNKIREICPTFQP
jgi:hypothetical protein